MGTFSAIKNKNQSAKDMSFTIQYMVDIKKTLHDGIYLNSGINCSVQSAHFEMMTTKNRYRKADKRMFYQFVQSFPRDTKLTPQEVHRIGLEFAQKQFPQFEVLVSTHCNTKNLHNHILVNSVSFENGKKLHQNHDNLLEHRHINDEICLKFGEQVLKPYVKGQKNILLCNNEMPRSVAKSITDTLMIDKNLSFINCYKCMSSREYRSAMKGQSFKMQMANTIDDCMKYAQSKEHFIYLMESEGYKMTWMDSRKNITFTNPKGNKSRDNSLHEDKYLKENLENEFRIRESFFGRTETAKPSTEDSDTTDSKTTDDRRFEPTSAESNTFERLAELDNGRPETNVRRDYFNPKQVKNLPTATDLQKISTQLTELKTMLELVGKPKEKSSFMAKIKLLKLRLPKLEWSPMWLLLIPMLLPLWVILSALVGLWNNLQMMLQ